MTTVAVIDDHPVFREGLARTIASASDMQVALTAASVEDYDAKLASGRDRAPDVVVLDLGLPGMSGSAAVEHVCAKGSRVLVVSADGSEEATAEDALVIGTPLPLCSYTGMTPAVTGVKSGAWQETFDSQNGNYDSCGYVVELTNAQLVTEAGGGWNDLFLDGANACSKARIYVKAYGFKNGAWTTIGTTTHAGQFTPATTGNQFNLPADCNLSAGFNFAAGYSKIRVVVSGNLLLGGMHPQATVAAYIGGIQPPS